MALTDLPKRQEAPVLAFDQSGNGHLLWTRRYLPSQGTEETGTDLVYRHWNGQAWSSEQILYHIDAYLAAPYTLALLEIDNATQLFVSYASAVRQAQWANGSWSPLSEWDYTLNIDIATAARDAAGNIHVAGYGDNSGTGEWDEYFADAYYATFDGNAWSTPVNLSSVDGAAYDIDLAFDAAGDLHFVWSDQGSPYSSETTVSTVFERVFDGDSWSANAAIIQFNVDQGVQDLELKADPKGDLHLAWAEGVLVNYAVTDLRIYYQRFDGMNWTEEAQVHDGPVGSWNLSMNVDGDALFLVWEEWPYGSETIYFSSTRSDMRPPSISRIWLPKIKKG